MPCQHLDGLAALTHRRVGVRQRSPHVAFDGGLVAAEHRLEGADRAVRVLLQEQHLGPEELDPRVVLRQVREQRLGVGRPIQGHGAEGAGHPGLLVLGPGPGPGLQLDETARVVAEAPLEHPQLAAGRRPRRQGCGALQVTAGLLHGTQAQGGATGVVEDAGIGGLAVGHGLQDLQGVDQLIGLEIREPEEGEDGLGGAGLAAVGLEETHSGCRVARVERCEDLRHRVVGSLLGSRGLGRSGQEGQEEGYGVKGAARHRCGSSAGWWCWGCEEVRGWVTDSNASSVPRSKLRIGRRSSVGAPWTAL